MKRLIIIPTYNEKENVVKMIRCLMAKPEAYDLLIVDDGSPDGTAELVREEQKHFGERLHLLERIGKLGLGSAYIAGFKFALERGYDRIFEMDCDFSHNPDDLVRLDAMLEERDVAIGSRYSVGVNVVNWPLGRLLISYFASKYVRLVTRMPVADATAGFVGYRREVLEAIDLDRVAMNGYGFQIEMKYTAWRLGFSVGEVSIIFVDRVEGTSKMSSGIFGEAFFGVLKLPFRKIKRKL
ncbi:MAG: polyprenol monophosphomannose synthase [Alistipes sp.]|nr:polyprenol monophosphomannose synthase [Alistipes sp.]MBR3892328.1 polyprenol monophosphomannose synthase [Alistipes sp.]